MIFMPVKVKTQLLAFNTKKNKPDVIITKAR